MRPQKLFLTQHAVERYKQRWRPEMTLPAARAELKQQLPLAEFVDVDGTDYIYRTPRGALLTVSSDGAVRTVLPMGSKKTTYRPRRRRR